MQINAQCGITQPNTPLAHVLVLHNVTLSGKLKRRDHSLKEEGGMCVWGEGIGGLIYVTYYSFSGNVVAVYPGELSRLQKNEDTEIHKAMKTRATENDSHTFSCSLASW